MIIATLKLLPGGDTSLSATERTTTGEVIRPPATVSWLAFRSRLCPGLSTRAARRGAGLYGREQGRDPSGARSSSRLLRPGDHESEPNRFGHDLTARPAEADALAFESPNMQAFYDASFSYVDGDAAQPNVAASVALRCMLRILFDYAGPIILEMRRAWAIRSSRRSTSSSASGACGLRFAHTDPSANAHGVERRTLKAEAAAARREMVCD